MPETIDLIREFLSDPDAPWYGSDLVPMVADLCSECERLKNKLAENPTVIQMLEAASMLQWRRCWECGHVGLHVDNIDPWTRCCRCKSMDTRQIVDASRKLQDLLEETDG